MRVLGIDPGLSGGLAVIDCGPSAREPLASVTVVLDAIDVPTLGVDAQREVDAIAVLAFIQRWSPIDVCYIERAQAMPYYDAQGNKRGQGASSTLIYGRADGALRACVRGSHIPLEKIESTQWKKFHGLKRQPDQKDAAVKEASRARLISRWPDAHRFVPNKGHHNRAEAALIAICGAAMWLQRTPSHRIAKLAEGAAQSSQLDLIR